LATLQWDGVARLETLLPAYFGAEDNDYTRTLSCILLVAAVRRLKSPGCQFQLFIVLQGPQGQGKSNGLKNLVGLEYFSDHNILAVHDPKKQMEMMEGVVLYELAELQGLGDRNIEEVKAFASRQIDGDRMSYDRFKVWRPRQCIFIGTVNPGPFLRDQTGNRRFGPVFLRGKVKLDLIELDRDQLWAEAAVLEAKGASIELPEELWGKAAEEQEAQLITHPWEDNLVDMRRWTGLSGPVFQHEGKLKIASKDLLDKVLLIPIDRKDQKHSKNLAQIMRRLGWEGPILIRFPNSERFKGYEKDDPNPPKKPPVQGNLDYPNPNDDAPPHTVNPEDE
jgi:predicted P-loop ATPase